MWPSVTLFGQLPRHSSHGGRLGRSTIAAPDRWGESERSQLSSAVRPDELSAASGVEAAHVRNGRREERAVEVECGNLIR